MLSVTESEHQRLVELCGLDDGNVLIQVESSRLVQALTSQSFWERADVGDGASGQQPSIEGEMQEGDNAELLDKGTKILSREVMCYLRCQLPEAPEELIEVVAEQLTGDELLAEVAGFLGVPVLVRTCEHPPTQQTTADAFRALAATLGETRTRSLVIDMIVPQLIDVDFADIFPLREPLAVLTDLAKKQGAREIEPRIVRSAGEMSAQPVYVVGIYADKSELIGQSAGESVEIAVDLAAREGLLRTWGIVADKTFFFGDKAEQQPWKEFDRPNKRLSEICSKGVDLSVADPINEDPMNLVDVAMRYKRDVEGEVGKSYTKRLRHKFSRGTIARRSFRYLVKPKVYTVS